MKLAKIALISCFAAMGLARLHAGTPTLDYYSYGWFNTSGYYPIEFWVTVDDSAGQLQSLTVDAYYESGSVWESNPGSGNGYRQQSSGWCNTVDGYTDGRVYGYDGGVPYRWNEDVVQFSF